MALFCPSDFSASFQCGSLLRSNMGESGMVTLECRADSRESIRGFRWKWSIVAELDLSLEMSRYWRSGVQRQWMVFGSKMKFWLIMAMYFISWGVVDNPHLLTAPDSSLQLFLLMTQEQYTISLHSWWILLLTTLLLVQTASLLWFCWLRQSVPFLLTTLLFVCFVL